MTLIAAESMSMAGFLVILFPVVLLGFMLFMQRVEAPLNKVAPEREVEDFLDNANPDELDTFVREGTESALQRWRQRLSLSRLLPSSARRNGQANRSEPKEHGPRKPTRTGPP